MALARISASGGDVGHGRTGFREQAKRAGNSRVLEPSVRRDADGIPKCFGKVRFGKGETCRDVCDPQPAAELPCHTGLGDLDLPGCKPSRAAGKRPLEIGNRKPIKIDRYLFHHHLQRMQSAAAPFSRPGTGAVSGPHPTSRVQSFEGFVPHMLSNRRHLSLPSWQSRDQFFSFSRYFKFLLSPFACDRKRQMQGNLAALAAIASAASFGPSRSRSTERRPAHNSPLLGAPAEESARLAFPARLEPRCAAGPLLDVPPKPVRVLMRADRHFGYAGFGARAGISRRFALRVGY